MNSQQTAALWVSVGPWVSMHLNEPSLAAALPYTRISKLSLLSSTTSNAITTAAAAPLHYFHPLPLLYSTSSLKLFCSLTFLFLVHVTDDAFISRFLRLTCLHWKKRKKTGGVKEVGILRHIKFVGAFSQTTKCHEPSFSLTTSALASLLPPASLSLGSSTRRWRGSEHPGDQSIKAASQPSGWQRVTLQGELQCAFPWPLLFKAHHTEPWSHYRKRVRVSEKTTTPSSYQMCPSKFSQIKVASTCTEGPLTLLTWFCMLADWYLDPGSFYTCFEPQVYTQIARI